MQHEKCKSCFECSETIVVTVRDERGGEWRESSVRRCANDQCWHIVGGTREDRLLWIGNVYDYKYFGDYELSPEQLSAVYEAKALAGLGVQKGHDGAPPVPYDRDTLGRFVREAWVRWAETQPTPKPSWLLPYDELSEADKEADRQIGEAVARWTLIGDAASAALVDVPAVESEPDMLRLAVAAVLEADTEFRANTMPGWEGDPLSDEIDGLRRVFNAHTPRSTLAPAPAGEDAIRKAGQVAVDALIDRGGFATASDDELADYLTRIVDACVRAALSRKGSDAQTVAIPTANCCICGRIIDTREKSEGGDDFGAETAPGKWTCSMECDDAVTGYVSDAQTVGGGMATEGAAAEAHVLPPRWRVFEDITHGWWGIEEDIRDGNTILHPKKMNREPLDAIVRAHNAALAMNVDGDDEPYTGEHQEVLDAINSHNSGEEE